MEEKGTGSDRGGIVKEFRERTQVSFFSQNVPPPPDSSCLLRTLNPLSSFSVTCVCLNRNRDGLETIQSLLSSRAQSQNQPDRIVSPPFSISRASHPIRHCRVVSYILIPYSLPQPDFPPRYSPNPPRPPPRRFPQSLIP